MDLTQEEWTSKQEQTADSVIVDVRTPEEYEAGFIEKAHLLDIREPQQFMDGLERLDPSKTYFIYCRSGARSAQACQIFKQQGIADCYNLLGGILEWQGDLKS